MGVAPLAPGVARPSADQAIVHICEYFSARGLSIQDCFRLLDRNGDGAITWDEFYWGIKPCAQGTWLADVTDDELGQLFTRFDRNGDGAISAQEFCGHFALFNGLTLPTKLPQPAPTTRQVIVEDTLRRIFSAINRMGTTPRELFNNVDVDGKGVLGVAGVERVVRSFQPDLSSDEFGCIWQKFNTEGSGWVSAPQFCQALTPVGTPTGSPFGTPTHSGCGTPTGAQFPAFFPGSLPVVTIGQLPWAPGVIQTVRACVSYPRSGFPLEEVFRKLDQTGSGTLTMFEFQRMITAYEPQLTDTQMHHLFAVVNASGTGEIYFEEFSRWFG